MEPVRLTVEEVIAAIDKAIADHYERFTYVTPACLANDIRDAVVAAYKRKEPNAPTS